MVDKNPDKKTKKLTKTSGKSSPNSDENFFESLKKKLTSDSVPTAKSKSIPAGEDGGKTTKGRTNDGKKPDKMRQKRKKPINQRRQKCTDKLTPRDRLVVCAYLAAGYTPQMIVEYLDEQHGIQVSNVNIHKNYLRNPKYIPKILRMRRFLEKKASAHPLMAKLTRLDVLMKAINEALTWRIDKIHVNSFTGEATTIYKRNIGAIPALIEKARIEAEGEKAMVDLSRNMTQIFLPERAQEDDIELITGERS